MSAESFRLIPPVAMHAAAPGWAAQFPQFDTVIGYSDLGHVFLSNADNECGVLHPYKAAAKSYGTFPDLETFADQVLRDPGFATYVLMPDHVAEIRALLGPLPSGHIYIPQPYQFLGGSLEPSTYTTGDIWVFLELVGQFQIEEAAHATPSPIRQFSDEQFGLALAEWAWLGIDGKRPVFATMFGDIFLGDDDGVWRLDIVDGSLTRLWASFDECEAALNDPAVGPDLLRTELADELVAAGLRPGPDQVYDFSHPPVLGGALTAANIEVLDFVVAVGTAGQIHDQARFIPEGAQISIAVDEVPRRSGWRRLFGGR